MGITLKPAFSEQGLAYCSDILKSQFRILHFNWNILHLYMDALIVYPENKEQLTALKAVMKAMKIAFEQKNNIYPDHFFNGINKSLQEVKDGQFTTYKGAIKMLNAE